jgi:hypothetical protein
MWADAGVCLVETVARHSLDRSEGGDPLRLVSGLRVRAPRFRVGAFVTTDTGWNC